MSDHALSQKASKKRIRHPKLQNFKGGPRPEDLLDEHLAQAKIAGAPLIPRDEILSMQQGFGNKAMRRLIAQRHAIPKGRQAVGDEEDEIQTKPLILRHAIPEGRNGIGEEDDEIRTMPALQRSPAFGRAGWRKGGTVKSLWGKGSSQALQRKDGEVKKVVEAEEAKKAPIEEEAKGAPKTEIPKVVPEVKKEPSADDLAVKAAKKDYDKFISGGPYRYNNYVPDKAVKGDEYGKFDAVYDPANKLLSANMRVKFQFPDFKETGKTDPFYKKLDEYTKKIQKQYIDIFTLWTSYGWSGKFDFMNVRQPKRVWGKLNPITVKVNVTPVDAGQHYTLNKYYKTVLDPTTKDPLVSSVSSNLSNIVSMHKEDPATMFTGRKSIGEDELKRLKRNLPKIHFARGSARIEAKYNPDLQYIADYLKRMSQPKFNIDIVGLANKTGDEQVNFRISDLRARAVAERLKSLGVSNHKITFGGVGSAGATEDGSWRKVEFDVEVDKSFKNFQDVTLHEFGHMLGLDDEYTRDAETRDYTTQKELMIKMLGSKKYGKGKEGKYAEEVTKIEKKAPEGSAGVMHAGSEVRAYNYVTFWQALYDTAAKATNQPTPPLSWKDWKVKG